MNKENETITIKDIEKLNLKNISLGLTANNKLIYKEVRI